MKILSWNVAGFRALIKKIEINDLFSESTNIDIICLQETKAEENQITLPIEIINRYPYRFWNSTKGTTQRKGLSGTSIWSKIEPIKIFENPEFDEEGRIIALEFKEFILINVYVPNSQELQSNRYYFRENWNVKFMEYLKELQKIKNIIVCGDMNVAHKELDVSNPSKKKNRAAGFYDNERRDFTILLEDLKLIDVFRENNPLLRKSTYWSNFLKALKDDNNGWRIDYFLTSQEIYKSIKHYQIMSNVYGSDHCPILIEL